MWTVFGAPSSRISALTTAVLTQILMVFSHSFMANTRVVPWLRSAFPFQMLHRMSHVLNIVEGVAKWTSEERNHGIYSGYLTEHKVKIASWGNAEYILLLDTPAVGQHKYLCNLQPFPPPPQHSYCVDWSRLKLTHVMTFLVASCCGRMTLQAITNSKNLDEHGQVTYSFKHDSQENVINETVSITSYGPLWQNNWWMKKDLEGSCMTQ
jgi:hypothetical protein